MDLLGDLDLSVPAPAQPPPQVPAPAPAPVIQPFSDPFGLDDFGFSTPAQTAPPASDLPVVLHPEQGSGISIRAKTARENGEIVYKLSITNGTASQLSSFMLQFNRNSFGLQPSNQVSPSPLLSFHQAQATRSSPFRRSSRTPLPKLLCP